MPEPAIIDTSVIQVKSTTKDTYGNLIVTPMIGDDFRVGAKRQSLFDVFQQGRAVKLYWAEYQHKKYVANAELFDGKPSAEVKPASPLAREAIKLGAEVITTKEEMTKDDWAEKNRITRKSIERQKSLELAVEVAKMKASDSTEKIIATAKMFEVYIEKGG